jgi:hypothetical protein
VRALILACVLALGVGQAQAADIPNPTTIGGATTCGTWTVNRRGDLWFWAADGAWINGFIAAFLMDEASHGNFQDPLRNVDGNAVFGWIDNYCLSNPLHTIMMAAVQFVVINAPKHPRVRS